MLNTTYSALVGLFLVTLAPSSGSTPADLALSESPNQVSNYVHQKDQDKDPSYRGSGR